MAVTGGIDLGGTKIEARLFDGDWKVVDTKRIPTPTGDYTEMLDAIETQARWLEALAGRTLPIGIGIPGLIDQKTGLALTANLPASGKPLRDDIAGRLGRTIPIINDCRAFTLSEARLGAGLGYKSVVGLVMGTGIAGGIAINGEMIPELNGMTAEFGHMPLPASVIVDEQLPVPECGCGQRGCIETYTSGKGIPRLARAVLGQDMSAAELFSGVSIGQEDAQKVFRIWSNITGTMIGAVMRAVDPECIVVGGGLSNVPGFVRMLERAARPYMLAGTQLPRMRRAEGGDSSGTRGAAMAARDRAGRA